MKPALPRQFRFDVLESVQSLLQIGNNGLRQNVGFGQVFQIRQRSVFDPGDVQTCFIAGKDFLAGVFFEPFRFRPAFIAGDKVFQIVIAERLCYQREVHIRAQIVKPDVFRAVSVFNRRHLVKEKHVRLDALRVKDSGRQAQNGMQIE